MGQTATWCFLACVRVSVNMNIIKYSIHYPRRNVHDGSMCLDVCMHNIVVHKLIWHFPCAELKGAMI